MRTKIFSIVFEILVLYLAALVFLYFNQRNMMYFPDTTRPLLEHYDSHESYEEISVTNSDGLTLNSWYAAPKNGIVIVKFDGNGGHFAHRTFKSDLFIRQSYGFLFAEYRGYGGNPGKPSEEGLYSDARAYLDWLMQAQGIQAENIILYGESLGTGVAVQMATEYKVGALILEAAYDSIQSVAQSKYFFVPVSLLMKDKFLSIEKIKDVQAPKLFIHGGGDRIILIKHSERLFDAANEPKTYVRIAQAGHNNLYDYDVALHITHFLSTISAKD